MLVLDSNVKKVLLQFFLSSPGLIPAAVKCRETKTRERRELKQDDYAFEPTNNCSIGDFPAELEIAGYKLIDAFWQQREGRAGRYYVVRFTFFRFSRTPAETSLREALQKMVSNTLWRVWAFNYDGVVGIFLGSRSIATTTEPRNLFIINKTVDIT